MAQDSVEVVTLSKDIVLAYELETGVWYSGAAKNNVARTENWISEMY